MPKKKEPKSQSVESLTEEEKAEMGLDNSSTKGSKKKTDETMSASNQKMLSFSEEEEYDETGLDVSETELSKSITGGKKKKYANESVGTAHPIDLASSMDSQEKKKHSKHHKRSKSSRALDSSHRDKKRTKVTIGEYEFVVPKDKLPLLKVMACAIVLIVSIFIDESIFSSNYRYGIILAVVAILGAIIGVVIPSKKAMYLNYFISVVTYAGACLNTIDPGPFIEPGNGYFASWGLAIYSAAAANPPGSLKRTLFHTTLNLGASALVVLLSLLPVLAEGVEVNEWEIYLAISGSSLTILIVGIFLALKLYKWDATMNVYGESIVLSILAVIWLGIACIVSYRGPFKMTGNGYFASWFACFKSIEAAWLEWKKNHDEME